MDTKVTTFFDKDTEIFVRLHDLQSTIVVRVKEESDISGEIAMYIKGLENVKKLHKYLGKEIRKLEKERKENEKNKSMFSRLV